MIFSASCVRAVSMMIGVRTPAWRSSLADLVAVLAAEA